jgi:D-alanyl-lipoteichoic acid acyltransferase DltB (MBOAT superfamily)
MLPQFSRPEVARFNAANFAVGLTVFAVGLFKKMVIADGCAAIADPVFLGFERGGLFDTASAWAGALAYAFQLYFDFSGYSDMAVGLARMFNIELPMNFNSPYKAASIVDFWRRWHITLSRFLRNYVYFALGGNRKGPARRYANILATMLLGGLWHGASWSFVLWGGAHGLMLIANHAWRALGMPGPGAPAGRILTFVAVVTAWVPFRMPEAGAAIRMLEKMYEPVRLLPDLQRYLETQPMNAAWLALVAVVTFALPNVYQLFRLQALAVTPYGERPVLDASRLRWSASVPWALATALLAGAALMQLGTISPFLYFQF